MISVGQIFSSRNDGDFEVIEYNKKYDVTVRFLSTGYVVHKTSSEIYRGCVKDKMKPSLYGVGFIGVGDFKYSIKGKHTKAGSAWASMIARCYSGKYPTYKDCFVCSKWHNFQNFAAWFYKNYKEGMVIDKDVKSECKKIYSPKTCLFLSPTDNAIVSSGKFFSLIDPGGKRIDGKNIASFCRFQGLRSSCIYDLLKGRLRQYKGWTVNKDLA
jgi:hypothetical protein